MRAKRGSWRRSANSSPLVLLASFSLVIGTFAASLSQSAAGYAIGASMGFLTGFSLLLLRRVFIALWKGKPEPDFVVLLAYGSIGVGLILLFLVPGEIAGAIPTVQTYRGIATAAVYAVFGVWLADIFFTGSRQRQQRFPRAKLIQPLYAVAAAGTLLSFGSLAVDALFPLLSHSLTGYVLPAVGFVFMVGGAAGWKSSSRKPCGPSDEEHGCSPEVSPLGELQLPSPAVI